MSDQGFNWNLILAKDEICIGDIILLEGGFLDLDVVIIEGEILVDESSYSGDEILVHKKEIS